MRLAAPLLLCLAAACPAPPRPAGPAPAVPDILAGLPPVADPAYDLDDEQDFERAVDAYEALPLEDPDRLPRRDAIVAALAAKIDRELRDGSRERAFAHFRAALELFSPAEIDAGAPALRALAPAADAVYVRFSTTGQDFESAAAVAVLLVVQPDRAAELRRTWSEIAAYSDDLDVSEFGEGARWRRPIRVLTMIDSFFPSAWVTESLVGLLLERQKAGDAVAYDGVRRDELLALQGEEIRRTSWSIVRAFAHAQRLAGAKGPIAGLRGKLGYDDALERAVGGTTLEKELEIFDLFAASPENADYDVGAALAICAELARRYPRALEPRRFAGESAVRRQAYGQALRWFEEARALDPKNAEVVEKAAGLRGVRVSSLALAERLGAAAAELARLEAEAAAARQAIPELDLDEVVADAHIALGQGYYGAGQIARAREAYERADKLHGSVDAKEQLATIALKHGRLAEAAAAFESAVFAVPRSEDDSMFLGRARLRRLAAEARRRAGQLPEARALLERARAELEPRVSLERASRGARASVTYVELARIAFAREDAEAGRRLLELAVDADPGRTDVYPDAIALLFTHGELAPALDAFHRGIGRDDLGDYFKVYTSLWVLYLARIKHLDPDWLAVDYLASRRGHFWHHELARFASGKLGFEELRAKATTRGRRAEAYFYAALDDLARGDDAEARRKLAAVIASDLLGFFEFDMAAHFLESGFPK